MTKLKQNIDVIFFSITLCLLGLFLVFNNWRYVHFFFVLLLFGSIGFMLPLKNIKDERLIKLKHKAAFHTFIFILALLFLAYLFSTFFKISLESIEVYITLRNTMMLILAFYSITYIILRRIY